MNGLARDSSVQFYLERLADVLSDPDVTEIAINGVDQVFVERRSRWEALDRGFSEAQLLDLGTAVARLSDQEWNSRYPLLSASVPFHSETLDVGVDRALRFQMVAPPAVPAGTYSMTIRKPSQVDYTLENFANRGLFTRVKPLSLAPTEEDIGLARSLDRRNYQAFMSQAVRARKNIVVAGATGSGKTTFMKSLVREIPLSERLVTLEDVRELTLPHPNRVHLLYSKGLQSSNAVTPRDLLEASLRMKPDRILLAEVRGEECLYYVRNAASGHPGSITSVHAGSPALAFEQMAIMIKDSRGGAFLDFAVIKRLLLLTIDIVVQFQNQDGERFISEIYFDPERQRGAH